MENKTVIITGATSGIGEVAAIRLAEQGARIVFTARDKARADDTMAALEKANLVPITPGTWPTFHGFQK